MPGRLTEILNVDGCVVKTYDGVRLAKLREVDGAIEVIREPACGLGMYFHILSYLLDLGFDVR